MMDANGMIEAIIFGGDGSGASTIEELTTIGGTSDAGKVLAVKNDGSVGAVTLPVSEGTVAIDTTLAITGAAPDSKVVGDAISALNGSLGDLDSSLAQIIAAEDVPTEYTLIPNSYVDSSGGFRTANNWSRTDYIPVTPGSTIKLTYPATGQYNFAYDENKNPVGSKFSIVAGENTITLRPDAHYIVLSGETANMQSLIVNLGDTVEMLHQDLPLTQSMVKEVEDIVNVRTGKDTFVNPTAYLIKQVIPNYYFDRNETAESKHDIGYLDDKINSIPNGYHFMFVTDTHWNDNAKQSTKLISYVRDRIGAKFVLFGGDILTAHSSEAEAYRWLCNFTFDFKNAFGSNFLPVVGNHDLNAAGTTEHMLMYSDLVPLFTQGCDNRFHYCDYYDGRIDSMASSKGMTVEQVAALKQYFRTCYYVDDAEGKTRFIIYNTGAGEGGSGITTFIDSYIRGSFEELLIIEWIYDVLMHTPTGYNVILSTHIPGDFSWDSDNETFLSSIRAKFAAVVAGMKARKNVTVYLPNPISDYSWWGGESTMHFNYTYAPVVGIVAVIGGHAHVDKFGRYGFTDTSYTTSKFGSITSAVNALSYTCHQSSDEYVQGERYVAEVPVILSQHDAYTKNSGPYSHTMELGTITEQVVDVVTITPEGNIALTRIGAGNDRLLTIQ